MKRTGSFIANVIATAKIVGRGERRARKKEFQLRYVGPGSQWKPLLRTVML